MATGDAPYLSQNDAIMWNVESDPLLRSSIVVVFLLDRAPDRQALERRVRQAIDAVPALRQRVIGVPLHPGSLQWVDVDTVDLAYHLRHVGLPAPAGIEQVLELARTTVAGGFDPTRPLWSFTLVHLDQVDDLVDDQVDAQVDDQVEEGHGADGEHGRGLGGSRAAFIVTAHHVVTDGIGAVALAAQLFDIAPDVIDPGATEPDPVPDPDDGSTASTAITIATARPGPVDRWLQAVGHDAAVAATTVASSVHDAVPNLLHALRHPVDAATGAAATVQSVARAVAPVVATRSPVMTGRTTVHRLDTLEVAVDDLRAAGRAGGGTLNDAFLAGITGGMRRYHEHHGAPVTELRMAMPISLRTDEHPAGGNHVTVLRTLVPIDVADPRDRIARLHEVGQRLRAERSLAHTETIAGVLNLLPRGVVGTMLKRVDFLASNVPGVPVPLLLAGSEVLRIVPFGPTAGSSVNLTLMSYRGRCGIGIHTDTAAIPDTDEFVRCISDGFDEVISLAAR